MNRATFTRNDLGAYRIDGGRLLSMIETVLTPLTANGSLSELRIKISRTMRTAAGKIESVSSDPASLVDGEVPKPDCVAIEIFGILSDYDDGSFLYSIDLDPRNGDRIYTAGPPKETEAAFETFVRVLEGAVLPPAPAVPESIASKVKAAIYSSWSFYGLLLLSLSMMMVGAVASIPLMVSGWGVLALGWLVLLTRPKTVYPTWEERLDARQASRVIDLSLPEPGPLAIGHLRLLPAPEDA